LHVHRGKLASPRPHSTTARIAPAQRAAHEPTGTLHRHATCSPPARRHTAARSAHHVGVPPSGVSNANPQHAPQAVSPRILPRKVWRETRAVRNRAHPSLARALPRRRSGLARLRAPMSLRSFQAGLLASLARPAVRHRCERSSHGARSVRLPFGPASALRHPSRRERVLRAMLSPLIHSRVWRSAHGRRGPPRFARAAPRSAPANAFASLSPPRETSRSICLPIARSGVPSWPAILPLPPRSPTHAARRSPPAWNGSRCSRP